MKSLGLYIHIPFCRRKCLYCDFCSGSDHTPEQLAQYTRALCADLEARAASCAAYSVDSIYFGGGTPTILPVELLISVLETVFRCFRVSPVAEITAECNPATGGREYFQAMRRAGWNRLSIGLQSAQENELKALGRIHSFSDFTQTFADARNAGFENISVDLMSSIPLQTSQSWSDTLERVCALSPEHISAYGLILEEGTPLFEMQSRLTLPDEDTAQSMYFDGIALLASHGYAQYEISNFARAGYESRHNLKYWSCGEYLGFGPAAYSDFAGDRFGNSRDIAAYIEGRPIECERETPSEAARINEYVMLGMRLCKGVSASDFALRFGKDFEACFGARLAKYLPDGFVCRTPDGMAFTPKGFYVSNSILSDILDFSE